MSCLYSLEANPFSLLDILSNKKEDVYFLSVQALLTLDISFWIWNAVRNNEINGGNTVFKNRLKKKKTILNVLPRWLSGKESACQCRRHGFDPWVRKILWRRKWQPTPVFLPGIKPRSPTLQMDSLPTEAQGKPYSKPNSKPNIKASLIAQLVKNLPPM